MAEKDFRVQKGIIVADGDITVPSDHSVFAGIFDTNVAAAGVTLTGTTLAADGSNDDINITIEPKGTGSVLATRIDSTVIGSATPAAATVTNLIATGTSTLRGAITTGNTGTATTITQNVAAADANGQNLTITAGSALTGNTNNTGTGGDLILAAGAGKGTAAGGDIVFKVATPAGGASNTPNNIDDIVMTLSDDKSVTFGGATNFQSNAMTNVNIDSGAIDDTTIGGGTPAAITGTTIDATTDFTIGSTVITDDSIVMTPSTSDTVTIAAATNGALNITTVDNNAAAANITLNADGEVRLQYGGSTKLASNTNGIEVTGKLVNTHARMRSSDAIKDSGASNHALIDIDGQNFYTSEILSVTESSGVTKTPNSTFGTSGASAGNVRVLSLNTAGNDLEVYQVAEALACMTVRASNNTISKRVVQKVIGYAFDTNHSDVESTVVYQSGDVSHGHFEWVKHTDGFASNEHSLTLIWKWTKPTAIAASSVIQYSANVHGLSLNGAGG